MNRNKNLSKNENKNPLPTDEITCGNNIEILRTFPDECIDLTVTSPPYDKLRDYKGFSFQFGGRVFQ